MTFRNIQKILEENGYTLLKVCKSIYLYKKLGVDEKVEIQNYKGVFPAVLIKELEKDTGLSFAD